MNKETKVKECDARDDKERTESRQQKNSKQDLITVPPLFAI
jgi:hypothetical protein